MRLFYCANGRPHSERSHGVEMREVGLSQVHTIRGDNVRWWECLSITGQA